MALIVVAYNDADLLETLFASVRAGTRSGDPIILVDNSTTDAVEKAFAARPGIRYRRTGENLGFCGANNLGMELAAEAGATHYLLLNHDTVLAPDCLERLARAAEGLGPGIVTGKIVLSRTGRLWYGGGYFSPWIGAGKNRGFGDEDRGQYDRAVKVSYATGCCLLIHRDVVARVGRLNEDLFMYLDDIEFCLRAAKAGFPIWYEPAAVVRHDLGSGHDLRSRPDYYLYFSIRNKPRVAGGPYRLYLYAVTMAVAKVKFLQFLLLPRLADRPAKLKAILWGLRDAFASGPRYRGRFPRLFG
jgi:GT2 family glycosyltransferase